MVQARSERTREKILLSAARTIDERNYERASLADIARGAGVTTGAFYFHFRNKEEIAHAVIDAQNAYSAARAAELTTTDSPTMEKILAVSADLTHSMLDNQLVRAGIRLTTEVNMFTQPPILPWQQWTDFSVALWTAAVQEGDVKPDTDLERYAKFITGAYAGIQLLSSLTTSRRDLVERILDMWVIILKSCTPAESTEYWIDRAQRLFREPASRPPEPSR
jgi:AcrR family transcriptional regulator